MLSYSFSYLAVLSTLRCDAYKNTVPNMLVISHL